MAQEQKNPKAPAQGKGNNKRFWDFRAAAGENAAPELILYGDIASETWWVDLADIQGRASAGTATAPKMSVGARVKYSGPLYRDSNGNGQGMNVNGTYTVKYYYPGRKCGVHIDGLGWVPESACSVVG